MTRSGRETIGYSLKYVPQELKEFTFPLGFLGDGFDYSRFKLAVKRFQAVWLLYEHAQACPVTTHTRPDKRIRVLCATHVPGPQCWHAGVCGLRDRAAQEVMQLSDISWTYTVHTLFPLDKPLKVAWVMTVVFLKHLNPKHKRENHELKFKKLQIWMNDRSKSENDTSWWYGHKWRAIIR